MTLRNKTTYLQVVGPRDQAIAASQPEVIMAAILLIVLWIPTAWAADEAPAC